MDNFYPERNDSMNTDEFGRTVEKLSANMYNKFFFNPEPYRINKGVTISDNYKGRNLRQLYFQNCTFKDAIFKNAGLPGSAFVECKFYPCSFWDTNLQSCDFRDCRFENVYFQYTRMNKSSFYCTTFVNCIFGSVSINDAFFDHCKFINCLWTISIENTVFKNTLLENTRFKEMNFEFSTFENIKAENIVFPFPTLPFIYNGLKYLTTTDDNIRISSAQKQNGLTKDEYLDYMDDLEEFYLHTHNYFPLTNIYIAKGKKEKAFEAIIEGIKIAIHIRSFRMIRYYCKQIKYLDNITTHQRQSLYFFILTEISKQNLKGFEKNMLGFYLPEVKDLLFGDTQDDRLQIIMETNIEQNEYEKITLLMTVLDMFFDDKGVYSIEFRHGSPYQGFLDVLTDPSNINTIISGLSLIANVVIGCASIVQAKKKKKGNQENAQLHQCQQKLEQGGIVINNLIFINNGNIVINDHDSSQGEIYLNK